MEPAKKRADRRVQRTRRLITQAFMEVAREKGFTATSIQDIADRANINRGTVYLHFADKYMLLDAVVRENFGAQLERQISPAASWDRQSLYQLILAVCTCMEGKYHHQTPRLIVPYELLERTLRDELMRIVMARFAQPDPALALGALPIETLAQVVSWAIFGPALRWSQTPLVVPAEQIASEVLQVIMGGVLPYISEAEREGSTASS